MSDDLIERLRKEWSRDDYTRFGLINPDGPAAIAEIERLRSALAVAAGEFDLILKLARERYEHDGGDLA